MLLKVRSYLNSLEKITEQLISDLVTGEMMIEDWYFEEAMKLDEGILETFGDTYPSFMDIQRPNEAKKQKEYRKAYFEKIGNPIKGYLGQIEKQIDKVFISNDCKIAYPNDTLSKESIRFYLERDYYNGEDFFKSFSEALKSKILVSPNSVLCVIPNETTEDKYARPYFLIVKPENVKFYKANTLCIIESELLSDVIEGDTIHYGTGKVYYIFDREKYVVLKHVANVKGQPVYVTNKTKAGEYLSHGCDFMPCKKIGRKIKEQSEDGHELRDSDLDDSMVFLRNAIMNNIDLAVEHNFHVASQEWAVGTIDCMNCRGTGKIKGEGDTKAKGCGTCGSTGKVQGITGNGLDKIIIPYSVDNLGRSERIPINVGGFVERPETGSRLFDAAFEKNIQRALQPFGLEHLAKVPLNQSGVSKDYDMQEGFAFVQSMSEHIESLFTLVLDAVYNMRYKNKKDKADRPVLIMPRSFNLSDSKSLGKKLQDAITYKLPEYIILKYEEELIEKEFGDRSRELQYFKTRRKFDPLPAAKYEEKLASRGNLSDYNYILSTNIDSILFECSEIEKDFLYLDYKTQKSIIDNIVNERYENAKSNLTKTFIIDSPTQVNQENI